MATYKYKATNPRDMIYALLGAYSIPLVPNYAKSVREVYVDFAKVIIERTETLVMLSCAGIKDADRNRHGLPSWLPDFSSHGAKSLRSNYDAGCSSKRLEDTLNLGCHLEADGSLRTAGYILDTISLREAKIEVDSPELIHFCQCFLWSQDEHNTRRYNGTPLLHVLFCTFFESNYAIASPPWNSNDDPKLLLRRAMASLRNILWTSGENEQAFQDRLTNLDYATEENFVPFLFKSIFHGRSYKLPEIKPHHARHYANTVIERVDVEYIIYHKLYWNYIFHTASGFLGLGREEVESGDLLCILNHPQSPVILRPVKGHYVFVGCCTVYGLMEGEAKGIIEAEGIEQKEFIIF